MKLEGQYQEWRATRPADVSQWTNEDLNTMVGYVQKNDLRRLGQLGIFGPVGATWMSITDGDYKAVVDNVALNMASSIIPVGTVGRTLGQAGEATIGASQEMRAVDRVGEVGGSVSTRDPSRFIGDAMVIDKKTGQTFQGPVDLGPTLDRIKSGGRILTEMMGRFLKIKRVICRGSPMVIILSMCTQLQGSLVRGRNE